MSNQSKRILRQKGRKVDGSFSAWPHACATSPNFLKLRPSAKALLFHFLGQYRGYNNGDLSCHWKLMKDRGWRSRTTVEKARTELEQAGWIVRTFQGSLGNRCNLYAITWQPLNECKAKLDVAETHVALGFWKTGNNRWLERDRAIRPKAKNKSLARVVDKQMTA